MKWRDEDQWGALQFELYKKLYSSLSSKGLKEIVCECCDGAVVGQAVTQREIKALEKEMGCSLPKEIKDFYGEHGALAGPKGVEFIYPPEKAISETKYLMQYSTDIGFMPFGDIAVFGGTENGLRWFRNKNRNDGVWEWDRRNDQRIRRARSIADLIFLSRVNGVLPDETPISSDSRANTIPATRAEIFAYKCPSASPDPRQSEILWGETEPALYQATQKEGLSWDWRTLAERCWEVELDGPPTPEKIREFEREVGFSIHPELYSLYEIASSLRGPTRIAYVDCIPDCISATLDFQFMASEGDFDPFGEMMMVSWMGDGDHWFYPRHQKFGYGDLFHWNHETDERTWLAKSVREYLLKGVRKP